MRESATLKLDSGDELRVEVERADLSADEILVRRVAERSVVPMSVLLKWYDEHHGTGQARPAGTTDRLLAPDRER